MPPSERNSTGNVVGAKGSPSSPIRASAGAARLGRLGEARQVALDVGGEHGHALRGELLGHQLQRLGLARPGRARDQPVAVHGGQREPDDRLRRERAVVHAAAEVDRRAVRRVRLPDRVAEGRHPRHIPIERPRISFMISSVPPPIGPRRLSRAARSSSGSGPSRPRQPVVEVEAGALGGQLGHRHLAHGSHGLAAVEEAPQRVVGQRRARLRRGGELGDRVADGLAAPREPRDGPLQRGVHRADRAERHQQPLPLEVGHDQVEAAALLAEQVLVGDEHVLEGDLAGVGGVPAELLELGRAHALAGLDDQERHPAVGGWGGCPSGAHRGRRRTRRARRW